jgi:hypothetical protein
VIQTQAAQTAGVNSNGSQGERCSMLRKTPKPISMACAYRTATRPTMMAPLQRMPYSTHRRRMWLLELVEAQLAFLLSFFGGSLQGRAGRV